MLRHYRLTVGLSEELVRVLIEQHGEDFGSELTGAYAVGVEATTVGLVCEDIEALDGPLETLTDSKAG